MIEVLVKGDRQVIYCNECRSKLAYEPNDIKFGHYGGNFLPDDFCYIECPVCNARIILKPNKEE